MRVDALLLGQHVDSVLISVPRHVSRMPSVYTAAQRIEALGIRLLGVILNGVQGDLYGLAYPQRAPARATA
jgi:Mrp family chromosome partitioning ATPase